jgi:AcrR family transcriptional regulator
MARVPYRSKRGDTQLPEKVRKNDHRNPDERSVDPIRKQLIEARRNQILDAATKVFAKKGFHRTTTKEIARTAGISEGTIYNYFTTKSDLLIGLITRLAKLETIDEELREALQGDVRDFFVTMLRHRLGLIDQAQEMVLPVLSEVLVSPELRQRFHQQFVLQAAAMMEQHVQTRIDMGHIRPIDARLTARILQGVFVGLLLFRVFGDEAILSGWEDIPEVLATIMFDGLSPGEGG